MVALKYNIIYDTQSGKADYEAIAKQFEHSAVLYEEQKLSPDIANIVTQKVGLANDEAYYLSLYFI